MKDKCAIYIMSCDATKDVAVHMLKSVEKYLKDLPYDIYFGVNKDVSHLNSKVLKIIPLGSEVSGWKAESLEQLRNLKENDSKITHVILILDDFVFDKRVDKSVFEELISQAINQKIQYLSMKSSHQGLLTKIFSLFRLRENNIKYPIYQISKKHEYYSSLQIALWDIDYLIGRIKSCTNIWEFENGGTRDRKHYAVFNNILSYKHIVEKGKWDFGAKSYCEESVGFFKPGDREFRTYKDERWQVKIISILIYLFGYEAIQLLRSIKNVFRKKG